ncbi:MAG: sugar phosphate isomerase/epimerase [Pseudomonadota bacterium]|nr:sugar phosphate isomerase/epimerase [Pseudomonadota bacterium]
MRLALCNEVVRELSFERQCAFARSVGYDGLEVAPFTLGDEPHLLPAGRRAELRRAAAEAGIAITGLHWLLVTPKGLSVTTEDPALRARTVEVIRGLVDLCADLGGRYLVHGSPAQRVLEPARETEQRRLAAEVFAAAGEAAAQAGLVYCIEPLAASETAYLTTVGEAADVVKDIGNPALRTMVDCSAAARSEMEDIPALLQRWLPTGLIAHVHANDPNRRGPGEGELLFAPILDVLLEQKYRGVIGVEPFIYEPDGSAVAARAAGYLRGLLEAQERCPHKG